MRHQLARDTPRTYISVAKIILYKDIYLAFDKSQAFFFLLFSFFLQLSLADDCDLGDLPSSEQRDASPLHRQGPQHAAQQGPRRAPQLLPEGV